MARAQDEEPEVIIVGDEEVSDSAAAYLDGILRDDETPVAVSALTVSHDDILRFERDGRTLIIEPRQTGIRRYKFGQDQTVEELVKMVPTDRTAQDQVEDENKSSIADRVRFWEEQDKINQELIPRVIRQNELLTEAALGAAKQELAEQAQATLDQALATVRQDMRQQYDAALDAAASKLARQTQTHLGQAFAAVREEAQKTRKVLVGLACVAVASGIAALIVVLLT